MSEAFIDEVLGTAYSDTSFSNTRDSDTGIWYRQKGAGFDFFKNIVRMLWNIVQVGKIGKQFRIYKDTGDSALQFSITGGKFWYGDTQVSYAGATAQALTDNSTNLISILTNGTIDIDTTWPATPHVKVAQIITASGSWVIVNDLTDLRAEQIFRVSGAIQSAELADISEILEITVPNVSGTSPQSIELSVDDKGGTAVGAIQYLIVSCHNDVDGGDVFDTDATIAVGAKGSKILDIVQDKELYCKTDSSGDLTITVTKPTTGAVYVMTRPYRQAALLDCSDIGTVTIT